MKGRIEFHLRLVKALTNDIPKRIANDAERFFKDSFKRQAWEGKPWRPRKKRDRRKGKKPGRRILVDTGNLMQSIRVVRADHNNITLTAGNAHVPYAQVHNEGAWVRGQVTRRAFVKMEHMRRTRSGKRVPVRTHQVRRHQARLNMHMPKRQFMGASPTLERIMRETITKSLRRAVGK